MKRLPTLCAVGLVAILTLQAQPETTIRTSVNQVLLDVVVRSKNQQFVRDLKASDFTILEDGVEQKVQGFRFIEGRSTPGSKDEPGPAPAANSGTPSPLSVNSLREVNLVSIVFRQMGREGREFAKQAALEFLKNELRGTTYVAVFSLDYRLNALVNYTQDRAAATKAIQNAATGAYSQFAQDSQSLLNQIDRQVTGGPGGISITAGFDYRTSPSAATMRTDESVSGEGSGMMAKILHDQMLTFADAAGTHELEALTIFVRDQAQLPGRKTVLYLSEGLLIAPNRGDMFRNLISQANRASVSFYAIDVRGLTTQDSAQAGISALRSDAAGTSFGGLENSNTRAGGRGQDDAVQLALHADTQNSMAELAESTGGFLIANTNELKKPMQRIMEDVRTHYELAYSPASENYDGHFRKISVKLARAGLRVQTRDGYFALPDLNGEPLAPFEFAALGVLNHQPLPKAFPFQAEVLHFRRVPEGEELALAMQVPMKGLSFAVDKEKKSAHVHASLFAVVKNSQNQVVARMGQDIPTEIPEDKVDQAKGAFILYSKPFGLPPGRYTLETAVLDRESNRASARKTVLLIGEGRENLVSSIMLVRGIEALKSQRNPSDPLQFDGGKLTPELSDTLKTGGNTGLFFVIYPKSKDDKPQVTLEFEKDGKLIARTTPEMPAVDALGTIPYIATAKLEPGSYDVRAVVRAGGVATERRLSFTIEP